MKKTIILFCFLTVGANIYAQVKINKLTNFNNFNDSLLGIFGQLISYDIAQDGYTLPELSYNNIHFIGYSLVCEVYFTTKCSYIFIFFGISEPMKKKIRRQGKGFRIRQQVYYNTFLSYIENNNSLPYWLIDHFRYQFITPYDDSVKDHAIYGEYKFTVSEGEGFKIVEKNIEKLKNKEEILLKLRTNF